MGGGGGGGFLGKIFWVDGREGLGLVGRRELGWDGRYIDGNQSILNNKFKDLSLGIQILVLYHPIKFLHNPANLIISNHKTLQFLSYTGSPT